MGTVDQLIISRTVMEEVSSYHQFLAVGFYDYKKAYDKVHHNWMLITYKWIGIKVNVITLLISLMKKCIASLEIWKDKEKSSSRWIDIMCGFPKGSYYSLAGFCIPETPSL